MHDDRTLVEARLRRVLDERIRPAVYPESVPLDVLVWNAPGEPVPVEEGLAATPEPVAVGDMWGAPWGTSWFTVTGTVPGRWAGRTVEAILDLGFDENMPGFQCEGLVYRPDGTPVKGLNPRNQWVRVAAPAEGGEEVRLHIEAASNPVILDYHPFVPTRLGDKETAGSAPQYRLARMDLAVFDETVWQLVLDLEVLGELMHELPADGARRHDILRAVARALDRVDLQDVGGSAAAARAELAGVLATPARPSAHRISAVGHAHIDSAWLWPLRETVRKVARTTANMTALLEDEPDFVFAMSQAQQFAWIKEHRPEVYAKVKKAVTDGRFVPAGGMWVESDTNMPGSEAMARQFVHGKRFFLDEFGIENDEAWLPDTFGFAAGLPQIIKAAGSKWLLTQKISWSQTNKFPHHTFQWEGIDGTRIFTHFPPVDTYNCSMKGSEIAHAEKNFKDKGMARHSLAPTGWGDGGGGTTREMVAKAARLRDLEGSATVQWETPAEFFTKAEAEYAHPPVWVGELYLELHRATLTSQAKTKQGNRRSEHLLREAELWAATAAVRTGCDYPYERLDRIWKTVLLHQFHDILPGSSIAWVHREAEKTYAAVAVELNDIIGAAQRALAGDAGGGELVFNAAPHQRHGVAAGGAAPAAEGGTAQLTERDGGGFVLDNGLLQVEIDGRGLVVSVYDPGTGRRREPAPDPPRLPQHVGRLGRRRLLPQHRHRPHGRRRGHRGRPGNGRGGPRGPLLRRLEGHPADRPRPGRQAPRHRHGGRLARDGEVPQGVLPAGHPRRAVRLGDPVRPLPPGHPHQHQLGGRQVRGVQPPLRPHGGAGLGCRPRQRLDLRARRHAHRPHLRRRDHDHPARVPAARAAFPRPGDRPGRPPLPPRPRPRRLDRRRGTGGLPHQPPRAPCSR
jgi:alpha-mannosidase